jgi:hypothetical protein
LAFLFLGVIAESSTSSTALLLGTLRMPARLGLLLKNKARVKTEGRK